MTKFHIINKTYFILLYNYLWYSVLFLYPIIVAILFNFWIFENHSTPLRSQMIHFFNINIIDVTFGSLRSIFKKSGLKIGYILLNNECSSIHNRDTKSTTNPYIVSYVDDVSYCLHCISIENKVKHETFESLFYG